MPRAVGGGTLAALVGELGTVRALAGAVIRQALVDGDLKWLAGRGSEWYWQATGLSRSAVLREWRRR